MCNIIVSIHVHALACIDDVPTMCIWKVPCKHKVIQGLSQEKDALIKEVSDLKEELVVAEQEKDKAIKEKKISEDFETKLEIERTKLLREVYMYVYNYTFNAL